MHLIELYLQLDGETARWRPRTKEEATIRTLAEVHGAVLFVFRRGQWSIVSSCALVLAITACGEVVPPSDATEAPSVEQTLAREEIARDLADVEAKVLALAEALSEEQYRWRPGHGVRSGGEVFMHIAAVNYAFPMFTGADAPADVGMSLDDFFPSIAAYEGIAEGKDEILKTLRTSFEHLRAAVESSSADLDRELDVFGAPSSVRGFWWVHLGHVHEHLGQLIAYSRSNGVDPPWS